MKPSPQPCTIDLSDSQNIKLLQLELIRAFPCSFGGKFIYRHTALVGVGE